MRLFSRSVGYGGASVLTDAVVASLQDRLDAGLAYREAAAQLGVKSETVRKGLQRGVLRAKKKRWAPGVDKSERSVVDAQAPMGMACTNSVERMLAALGLGGVPLRFEPCRSVTFGGVLCALPALAENGLFDHQAKLPVLPEGYYALLHILLLLAYMALCRIRTAEQLRYQPPGELGKLMGLDRIPEVRNDEPAACSSRPPTTSAHPSSLLLRHDRLSCRRSKEKATA